MSSYILKTHRVYVNGKLEAEYRTESCALNYASWWKMDQGKRDVIVAEGYIECPVINGQVYIPTDRQGRDLL